MIPFAKAFPAILLALAVSACGLNIPYPDTYTKPCVDLDRVTAGDGEAQIFYASSALRDCRSGKLKLSGFRSLPENYGKAIYRPSEYYEDIDEITPRLSESAKESWLSEVDARSGQRAGEGKLVVFIHGFNNSFDQAFRKAAKVAELNSPGVPVVVLHWPSRASALSYTFDEATIWWAQDAIDDALADLTLRANDITIVAHSMGTRAAIRATLALDRIDRAKPSSIKRIVLASGDVDRDAVLRVGGSADRLLAGRDRQILVYASHRDFPLQLSRRVHAYDRLGTTSCRNDISRELRQLGTKGNCHLAKERPGLTVISSSPVNAKGKSNHNDFIDQCHTREHFRAFLRGLPRPFEKATEYNRGLSGFEIDPDAPDPDGLCSKRN